MNTSDSERLSSGFSQMGFDLAEDPFAADVFVLNTCVVRQSAEDTATGMLGRLGKEKKNSGNQIIGVTGCMVGPEKSQLKRRFPHVDVWSGPQEFGPILELAGVRHGLDPSGCLSGLVPETPHVSSFIPVVHGLSLIHICRCRRLLTCRSGWSAYH